MKNHQIFLGGTAGKSTWRKEIAIPIIEGAGATYFNPQLGVGEWTPAHMAVEEKAKEEAKVWLFVVSDETRGVASLVEAAYRIGTGEKIALVVQDFEPEAELDGESLSKAEIKDLNRGRAYLREVAEKNGIPVYKEINEATQHALDLLA